MFYILNADDTVTPCEAHEFEHWLTTSERRRIADTNLGPDTRISTVFLGLDHRFSDGPPLLFETMVFTTDDKYVEWDQTGERYESVREALLGHAAHILMLLNAPSDNDEVCVKPEDDPARIIPEKRVVRRIRMTEQNAEVQR